MAIHSLNFSENLSLKEAYSKFQGDPPTAIPFLVWLIENPDSPLALPGKIYLREHDYLHILLDCNRDSIGEAIVIGTTMGNDPNTNWLHLSIFKFFARLLYPRPYKFSSTDCKYFDWGVASGKKLRVIYLNQLNFEALQNKSLKEIRQLLGIDLQEIKARLNS